jgi:ribosome-associated protein
MTTKNSYFSVCAAVRNSLSIERWDTAAVAGMLEGLHRSQPPQNVPKMWLLRMKGGNDMAIEGVRVKPNLIIPEAELTWRYSASSGPGGQHVNTTNSKAELVFDVLACAVLSDPQKARITAKLGIEIRVACDSERSQLRNKSLARARLAEKLAAALHVPRMRRPTEPSRGAVERRLQTKARQSTRKLERKATWE